MQQLHLIRLLTFIALLIAYSAFFDQSFQQFVTTVIHLRNLNIHYIYLLNCIGWIFGMWGLLVFLNSSNNKLRISSWILFVATSFINYSYFKILQTPVSFANIDKFNEVILRFGKIHYMESLQFIVFTAVFIIFARYLKPLSISCNTIFLIILAAIIIITITAHAGNEIPLPSIYVIVATIIYKYYILLFELARKQ